MRIEWLAGGIDTCEMQAADVAMSIGTKAMERNATARRSCQRATKYGIVLSKEGIDRRKLPEELSRSRIGSVTKQEAHCASIDRVAGCDSDSSHRKPGEFRARHQFNRGIGMAAGNRANRRNQANQIAQRAWKNHQNSHPSRVYQPAKAA